MSLEGRFDQALTAMRLLALDPGGLGGMVIRARSGPVRDRLVQALDLLPLPRRRIHPQIDDTTLFGGLDLAATLAEGRPVTGAGLIARPAALVLAMAERATPDLAARLAQMLDAGRGQCLIALDEGAAPDETLAPVLRDRLAFHVTLDDIPWAEAEGVDWSADLPKRRAVTATPDDVGALVALAARCGIDSLRAPIFALRAARAHAALQGRATIAQEDLEIAAALVLAPRAQILPETEEQSPPPDDPPPPPDDGGESTQGEDTQIPEEMLIEAVLASLPGGILETIAAAGAARGGRGSGAGARRKGNRRGRPLPSRPGRLDGSNRIDLVATLRTAAPWQRLRAAATDGRLAIHPSDIRLKRYEDKSDRLLVFTVDASGSAALARLAEAKGAIELLLAEAYAQRDHVALIAFRRDGAEALLPPTRSLVQTKRRLAGLPGGGGTPLAAGLQSAGEMAEAAERHGLTPTILVLTDGRANIALDGRADRAAAQADALQMAGWLRRYPGLVLDVGNRPSADLKTLAGRMNATYLPLPRADATRLSAAVGAALGS